MRRVILLLAWVLLGRVNPAAGADLMVFAAASLADSLKEIAANFERGTDIRIKVNLGASSTLARQIEEGAPADLFFSADEVKMDRLEQKGLIVKETRISRLSNSLVIIVAAKGGTSIHVPADLAKPIVKRLALGDPKAVPIGVYAKKYIERLGLWQAVEGKIVATENVRAALAAVESGDADASIVYQTDALISKKVKVVFEVPAAEGPRISYPMAVVRQTKEPEAAKRFLSYLASDKAGRIFEKYGFLVPAHSKTP